LIPYKLSVDAGNVVGKAASGDTVYTANREKAITITSGSAGNRFQLSGITFSVSDSKGLVKKSVNAVLDNFTESVRAVNKSNDNAITLQVDAKANQAIRISLTDMRSEALGLKSSDGTTISVATQKHANAAVNVLDNAIQKALDQQTDIGAVANRMEQTSNNLHIARDNVQASESTIRDVDMAKAMTSYTRNNILLQAAQSMLAQANQSGSNVLSLLQ
jgi:flagellin